MLKTVIFWLEITLSFWKSALDQTWKAFNTKFCPQWKDPQNNFLKISFSNFRSKLCLLHSLRVMKSVKQIKFEGLVRSKKLFPETTIYKRFEVNMRNEIFIWNSALWEKLNIYFSWDFCLYWQSFYFQRRAKHYAIIPWIFEIFLMFLKILKVVRQLVRQLVYTSLLPIITLRFTFGERKIRSAIKNSQNIISMIVIIFKYRCIRKTNDKICSMLFKGKLTNIWKFPYIFRSV